MRPARRSQARTSPRADGSAHRTRSRPRVKCPSTVARSAPVPRPLRAEYGLASAGAPAGAVPPHRRVERREEPVLDQHAGTREGVHQRRLAGVRVADERDGRERDAGTLVTMEPSGALHVGEPPAELGDSLAYLAPVDLELRLARAPRPDP